MGIPFIVEVIVFAIDFEGTGKTFTVFCVSITVTIGIEAIGNYEGFIASTIFIEVIPVVVDLVFIQHLIAVVQSNTVLEIVVFTINVAPATTIIVITGAIVITVTIQGFNPYTGGKFTVNKVKGYIPDFYVAMSADFGCGIKIIPIGTNHLPIGNFFPVYEVIPVTVFFQQAGVGVFFTAVYTSAIGIIVTACFYFGTPVNNRLTGFAISSADITVFGASCIFVQNGKVGIVIMPRVNNIVDHGFHRNGTAESTGSIG